MKKIAGLALLAVACGGETTAPTVPTPPPPPPNPVGTYNLTTINAVRLPVTVTLDGVAVTITSSVLNIRNGNTFSANMSAHNAITGVGVTVGGTGTWTQVETTVTMRFDSGGCTDLAVIEGRTLRIARDCAYGWEMVYQR